MNKDEALRAYDAAMCNPQVPEQALEFYDSCSWRRVGLKGPYKTVMQPTVASDGQPDISGSEVLRALVAAFNAMLVLREEVGRELTADQPCAKHQGLPFTMSVGYAPPPKSVCPICEPPMPVHEPK